MPALDTTAPETRIRALEDALHIAVGFLDSIDRSEVSDRWLREWQALLGEQTHAGETLRGSQCPQ